MSENKKTYDDMEFEYLNDLSDDEAIIELDKLVQKNDKILEQASVATLIEQDEDENLIFYNIKGLHRNKDEKAYKNRLTMRRNPPILEIKDSDENEVSFLLTENLVKTLQDSLGEVERAYNGYAKKETKVKKESIGDKLTKLKLFMKDNPAKAVAAFALIGMFIHGLVR